MAIISIGDNRYIIGDHWHDLPYSTRISLIENAAISWTFYGDSIAGGRPGMCKLIGQEGVVSILNKRAYKINYAGIVIDSPLVLIGNYHKYVGIVSDGNQYYLALVRGQGNDSPVFLYNSNFQLIKERRVNGQVSDMTPHGNYLYVVSNKVVGTSFHAIITKLTKDSLAIVWEKILPDSYLSQLSVGEDGIYHGAIRYTWPTGNPEPVHDGWIVTKLDMSGNIAWQMHEPGNYPSYQWYINQAVWFKSIVALPGGGCLIAGSKKHLNEPIAPQAMLARINNGQIIWQKDIETSSYNIADKVILDEQNYAVTYVHRYNIGVYLVKHRLEGITSVTDTPSPPEEFALLQNYPNPFNPSTTIRFSNPKDSYVKLTVHDLLGRKVKTLVNEYLSAGLKEFEFHSDHLPNGTYFYHLTAGDKSEIKKMLLLK